MTTETVSAAQLERWCALLDKDEIAAAERHSLEAGRAAYVACHALTRRLLERVAGVEAAMWRFAAGELGKPHIVDPSSPLHFSHSHAGGLVACAVAAFPVGIDAEQRNRAVAPATMEAVLAPSERALLMAAAPASRAETFLQLWTLREALVKATGRGLSFPREEFAFALEPPRLESGGEDWTFFTWKTPDHVLALAAGAADPVRLVQSTLAPEEL